MGFAEHDLGMLRDTRFDNDQLVKAVVLAEGIGVAYRSSDPMGRRCA